MQDLGMGGFTVKLNHRKLLDAVMRVCGVPSDKFRATCSAIDKLDKEPWEAVQAEMVQTKGVPAEVSCLKLPWCTWMSGDSCRKLDAAWLQQVQVANEDRQHKCQKIVDMQLPAES